jgi:hypothetical protein
MVRLPPPLLLPLLFACSSGKQTLGWERPGEAPASFPGDTFIPWHGGPAYFGRFQYAPSSSTALFPLSVWMQNPINAAGYRDVGVNVFTGLWQGPTEEQLGGITSGGLSVLCDQAGVWDAHLDDPSVVGWLSLDGPDNAQQRDDGGYDPCIPPEDVIARYQTLVDNDPRRPVFLGLGRGAAETEWVGRGECTGRTDMYPEYQRGADILSFHVYPVNNGGPLALAAAGVENLLAWSNHEKPIWFVAEASSIDGTARPAPWQIKAQVWMALVHGAAGIMYFCHRFEPSFSETDCLEDAPTAALLSELNAQINELAPVLNSQSVANGVSVSSSNAELPVDVMLKRRDGVTYLFAVAMAEGSTTATFNLERFPEHAFAEVLGESRTIGVTDGAFADDFADGAVHLYRISN